jgi:hypothetical protein
MTTFYDVRTGKRIVDWDEYVHRKVFYIHGTTSSPERWKTWPKTVGVLNEIALPMPREIQDTGYDWSDLATLTNTLKDRWEACHRKGDKGLVDYVTARAEQGDEIALVGHSHGGNLAIMAADRLASLGKFSKIYLLTVATPVFNEETFVVLHRIEQFKLVRQQEMKSYSRMIGDYSQWTEYTYLNPENPINWGKNREQQEGTRRTPIQHLALYNRHDHVDGIAMGLEGSRMKWETCRFQYNPGVNVEIKSELDENVRLRREYMNECSHRISLLLKLRGELRQAIMPTRTIVEEAKPSRGQDNTFIPKSTVTYERIGYREISPFDAPFASFDYVDFLRDKGNGKYETLSEKRIAEMTMEEMLTFFFGKMLGSLFYNRFKYNCMAKPVADIYWPTYDLKGLMDGRVEPMRSDPIYNIRIVDAEIRRIYEEIADINGFNKQVKGDRVWDKLMNSPLKHIPSIHSIKYISDGIDDHSFDTYSPELIELAIREKRIIPFANTKKNDPTIQ